MQGHANRTVIVGLYPFSSLICAGGQQQPNWCLTAEIQTAQCKVVHPNPKQQFLYDVFVSFQLFVYRETE